MALDQARSFGEPGQRRLCGVSARDPPRVFRRCSGQCADDSIMERRIASRVHFGEPAPDGPIDVDWGLAIPAGEEDAGQRRHSSPTALQRNGTWATKINDVFAILPTKTTTAARPSPQQATPSAASVTTTSMSLLMAAESPEQEYVSGTSRHTSMPLLTTSWSSNRRVFVHNGGRHGPRRADPGNWRERAM